ncbi:hypothetical protein TELCIR_09274 [Teladorsagia circumcincta]|uniref:Major facilitator superfamily (MFS) profile domain-containing protein n=1 Tax=Teladorsagia circumcincta TaxID=45464 RepID=A0A2G9UFI3_TELCI|nr:hypothetical protein TELCIR_09274 [Teladorsagia circumcincta]
MIPFISQLISKNILGIAADYLKRNNILGHTKCAKIFQSIGSFGSATMLIALATLPDCEHPYIALPLLALYGAFFSAGICGFFTCILCIAPPFTGTTTSISMVFGMLGNISGPLMLGVVSKLVESFSSFQRFSFSKIRIVMRWNRQQAADGARTLYTS